MESNTPKFTNEFQKSLKFTLKWEGGYVNDPDDRGGETKWGISKRSYPEVDVAGLTPEEAATIYFNDYWTKAGCAGLAFPYSAAVFDTAVNCGVSRAQQWVRASESVQGFLELRKQHYIQIINKNTRQMKYLNGWMNRLNDLKKFVDINSQRAS